MHPNAPYLVGSKLLVHIEGLTDFYFVIPKLNLAMKEALMFRTYYVADKALRTHYRLQHALLEPIANRSPARL